jgi:hypothetical protein
VSRRGLLVLAALVLPACGEPEAEPVPEPGPGRWHHARLETVAPWSGLAVAGDSLLLVAGDDDRALHVVARDAVEPGAVLASRALPLAIDADAPLTGGEPFAARGYTLGDLWDLGVDFTGVAFQPPDHLFVADRAFRVVYAGRLVPDERGAWRAARLERAFTVPGADRSGAERSDWRDQEAARGGGLLGLSAVRGRARTEDLYALLVEEHPATSFRLQRLDRFGLGLGSVVARLPADSRVAVAGVAWDDGRHLVVGGPGRGLLIPVADRPSRAPVEAASGVPGPDVEDAGPWRGLARADDGTLILVGSGTRPALAWR